MADGKAWATNEHESSSGARRARGNDSSDAAAGVIVTEKVGRVRSCRIEPKALREAEQWLGRQRTEWERQLDLLDDYLKGN
jgi:hypothetical protein